MVGLRERGLVWRQAAVAIALGALAVAVVAGQIRAAEVIAAALVGFAVGAIVIRIAARWDWLLYGLAAADLLIPEDDRYTLHGAGSVGFELEPWRILVTVMVLGWLASVMVDPRVRPRKTLVEGPLLVIWLALVGSEIFNAGRVGTLQSDVIKALVAISILTIFLYVVVSVVRTRAVIDRLLQVLVAAGCVVALGALVERATKFNLFDHLHGLLFMFTFKPDASAALLLRNGHFRALASAGHPIELANEMAMLTPIAAYLGIRHHRLWWGAVPLLVIGNLSSGSRTGVVGLLVVLVVFLCMRPRQTARCWPALIPILLVVEVLMPSAIGGTVKAFFPKDGLIAQQSQTFWAYGQVQQASRLSRLGPQLHGVFAKHNEFFGEGYGTRITGRTSTGTQGVLGRVQAHASDNAQILDDQWLGTLLDAGLLGVAGWMWLFVRIIRRLAARARQERGAPEGWLPVALAAAIACYGISMYFYDAFSFMQGTVVFYLLLGCASAGLWLPTKRTRAPERGRPAQPAAPATPSRRQRVPVGS